MRRRTGIQMTDNQHPGARPGPDGRYGRSVVPPGVVNSSAWRE
jgi:hypothetical protein